MCNQTSIAYPSTHRTLPLKAVTVIIVTLRCNNYTGGKKSYKTKTLNPSNNGNAASLDFEPQPDHLDVEDLGPNKDYWRCIVYVRDSGRNLVTQPPTPAKIRTLFQPYGSYRMLSSAVGVNKSCCYRVQFA